ncbi:MAG: thiamine pyrophosphate-binding protein [Acidobacteriota bacterium]
MKLSDFIAGFLAAQGIRHVFAITGGASLHIIDSVARTPGIDYICPQHEQAGAMAADGYAKATGNLGCALATSGPGATNLLTGIICSWFDSVPVLYLTGQVTTFRLKGNTGVRQMGFQETEIVEICRPVTKYAVMVTDWRKIRCELEKAVHIARSGRPGPVLVDVPDDLQRMDIDPAELEAFDPGPARPAPAVLPADLDRVIPLLGRASRPVLILGWGVRLAGAVDDAVRLAERLGFPVLLTWPALDFMPASHPLVIGAFGTHGTRYANYALQNADLVLAVGARLDTREAGSPYADFVRGGTKIVVDIDPAELRKLGAFGMQVDVAIHSDAGEFVRAMLKREQELPRPDLGAWRNRIDDWKRRYPICAPEYRRDRAINPYVFVEELAKAAQPGEQVVLDTGCALAWMCQAFQFKQGQRLYHAFNTTAMGYALPAAIGVSFATGHAPVTCVAGDGALQMNIQELATIVRHRLPIRIFLINNHGYGMVQQTQEQWLGGRYEATTVENGLAFPDFVKVARAYGIPTVTLKRNADAADRIGRVYASSGPVFCNVEFRPHHQVIPQVKFGRPIEDGEPLLPRTEFFANMLVEPTETSRIDHEEPAAASTIPDEGKA